MSTSLVTASQNSVKVNNQYIPDEGPKTMPVTLNFATANNLILDLTLLQQQGWISMVQTLYIDTSLATVDTIVTVAGSGQNLTIPSLTQGYYPVLASNPVRLTFANVSGSDIVQVQAINTLIPPIVWSAT